MVDSKGSGHGNKKNKRPRFYINLKIRHDAHVRNIIE